MAELKIKADSGGGTVSLKGPATTTSNAAVQLTLPVDDGSADQYLKTDGSGALSWAAAGTTINNNADNRVITGSGTANTLEGEANLTFNGSQLDLDTGSGTFNRWKTDQLRFNSTGTAHIDHYTTGQQFKFRTSASSGADTTCLEIFSNGNVEVSSGNLVIGTSGKGIDFSATADGTGSSQNELLSDYEYGKWTPTCKSSGTVNAVTAEYIRVGHFVWIHGYVNTISDQTSTDTFRIEGLPFTVESLYGSGWESKGGSGACMALQCSNDPAIQTSYSGAADDISFGGTNSGSWHNIKHSHFNHVNAMVTFTATYTTS